MGSMGTTANTPRDHEKNVKKQYFSLSVSKVVPVLLQS